PDGGRNELSLKNAFSVLVERITAERPETRQSAVRPVPDFSPARLRSLLNKAKAFAMLKRHYPEVVADVDVVSYADHPLVTDFDDYEVRLEEAYHFNREDTLALR